MGDGDGPLSLSLVGWVSPQSGPQYFYVVDENESGLFFFFRSSLFFISYLG